MKIINDDYNYVIRLNKGDKLIESLTKLAKENDIESTWIMGLGACSWAELGFYDLKKQQYNWRKLNQDLEILSLQGNIAWQGEEPIFHIHGTFSDESFKSIGGHVKELEVAGTCEIFLHKWDKGQLKRTDDAATGLMLLDL